MDHSLLFLILFLLVSYLYFLFDILMAKEAFCFDVTQDRMEWDRASVCKWENYGFVFSIFQG